MHPPSSAGGAPVNSYRVNISNGTIIKQCSAPVYFEPNCIISGLEDHHVYWSPPSRITASVFAPTDPEFVIPVASSAFDAVTSGPVVSGGEPVVVQVTGIRANGEGIYPLSPITVHVGATIAICHASPFGECLLTLSNPPVGSDSIYATYSGFGRSYQSPTSNVTVTT